MGAMISAGCGVSEARWEVRMVALAANLCEQCRLEQLIENGDEPLEENLVHEAEGHLALRRAGGQRPPVVHLCVRLRPELVERVEARELFGRERLGVHAATVADEDDTRQLQLPLGGEERHNARVADLLPRWHKEAVGGTARLDLLELAAYGHRAV
eukprot:5350565-Prymnesium_polylepis.1